MTKLTKFCLSILIKAFIISIPLSVVNIIVVEKMIAPQGRYFEIDMPSMLIVLSVIESFLLTLSMITIFFNKKTKVRQNIFLSTLTFYWGVLIAIYYNGLIGSNA